MKSIFSTIVAALAVCFFSQMAGAEDGDILAPDSSDYSYESPEQIFGEQTASEFVNYGNSGSCCNAGCNSCCEPWYAAFRSDHEFDTFMEPVTNPVFFEDPRSKTRLRIFFLNQQIPEGSALGGGDYQGYHA